MALLSGDQKGDAAPSVPANGCAVVAASDRSQRRDAPSPDATKTICRPSGERANDVGSLVAGVTISVRVSGSDGGIGAGRQGAHAMSAAISATLRVATSTNSGRTRRTGASIVTPPGIGWPAIHLSSSTRSTVDCHRASGSFARQRRTTRSSDAETSGRSDETAGGSVCTTAPITEDEVAPSNALRPVSISNSTAPNAKMSLR